VWTPKSGILRRDGRDGFDMFITHGHGGTVGGMALDPFGAYPMDFQAHMGPAKGWWPGKHPEGESADIPRADIYVLPEGASFASTTMGGFAKAEG
jgi:hypothetical protein